MTRSSSAPVCPVSALTGEPLSWLWPGRLALGKLALLEGDPGLGKSLLALDLCARLSRGLPWPDGSPGPGPANSLVLNGEDGPADTLRPRLDALGADLARIFVLRNPSPLGPTLRLPGQLSLLAAALRRTDARLVVIDPFLAFLDAHVCAGNDQAIRSVLAPLAALAELHRCVILLLRHLVKGGRARAIYRGGGSIGLVGTCRSAWLLARDPIRSDQCVLAQVKNNLAPPQPSLACSVAPNPPGPPRLTWLGVSSATADQLTAGTCRGTTRSRARDFLLSFLQAAPHRARDVWGEAQKQRLSARTLQRARTDLGIRSARIAESDVRCYYWLLPGQELPGPVDEPTGPADLEPWLAPLRRLFPAHTPLDEP